MASSICTKCGNIKKSGKRSCCARGGAWFKNCGDIGEKKFDHTWTEGIQACKYFVSLVSDKAPLQVMLNYVGKFDYRANISTSQNDTEQQSHIYHPGSVFDAKTNCGGYGGFANSVLYDMALLILSHNLY